MVKDDALEFLRILQELSMGSGPVVRETDNLWSWGSTPASLKPHLRLAFGNDFSEISLQVRYFKGLLPTVAQSCNLFARRLVTIISISPQWKMVR